MNEDNNSWWLFTESVLCCAVCEKCFWSMLPVNRLLLSIYLLTNTPNEGESCICLGRHYNSLHQVNFMQVALCHFSYDFRHSSAPAGLFYKGGSCSNQWCSFKGWSSILCVEIKMEKLITSGKGYFQFPVLRLLISFLPCKQLQVTLLIFSTCEMR